MNITEKIKEILQYYLVNRNIGHTTLLKHGIDNFGYYDQKFFVLCRSMGDYIFLSTKSKNIVSWNNIEKLRGYNRPLAIDNGAMIELLSESLSELSKIETLEKQNKELLKKVDELKTNLEKTKKSRSRVIKMINEVYETN